MNTALQSVFFGVIPGKPRPYLNGRRPAISLRFFLPGGKQMRRGSPLPSQPQDTCGLGYANALPSVALLPNITITHLKQASPKQISTRLSARPILNEFVGHSLIKFVTHNSKIAHVATDRSKIDQVPHRSCGIKLVIRRSKLGHCCHRWVPD